MLEKIVDYVRFTLYILLGMVVFFLFQEWDKTHQPQRVVSSMSAVQTDNLALRTTVLQGMGSAQTPVAVSTPQVSASTALAQGTLVQVDTNLFEVTIDTRGGDIITAKLLKYPDALGSKNPYLLLNSDDLTRYIAESGLLSSQGPDTPSQLAIFTAPHTHYVLSAVDNDLVVPMYWQNHDGLKITKIFTFMRDSYEVKVEYVIDNQSKQTWTGNFYTQLTRTNVQTTQANKGLAGLTTYFGAAISSPQKSFQKITFKEMQEKNLSQVIQDGWAAMVQHYFVSAWIPPKTAVSTYYSRAIPTSSLYTIGMMGPELVVTPGSKVATGAKLFTGPALTDQLRKAAPGLQLTIDYGVFWFISAIIFWMMQKIYDVVGNWGWSIVLVTIIIKLLFYQLSAKSYRSMSAMKKLQPKIDSLKEQYKDNKQKFTQATVELYRQEKVNPMSGCLPLLVQIPVFIALYWVLVESVQLRQAPFIFWIHDLSQHDPYYVLPLLMGLSMFLQQRLNPPPPDPMQAKIMMLMPIVFTVLFMNFPAGLMLYWFVNNTLSLLQQWRIMKHINKETYVVR